MYHLLETLLANITTLVMVIVLGFVLLTRWREKEVIRTDTVHLESTRTDTIPVRYVPSFYKYCTAFAILVLMALLLRLAWWLYKHFL